jgi:hypothetical protein
MTPEAVRGIHSSISAILCPCIFLHTPLNLEILLETSSSLALVAPQGGVALFEISALAVEEASSSCVVICDTQSSAL